MKQLRITGVVRNMNLARKGWISGVPLAEMENFRLMVRSTIAAVEQICRQHRIKPELLPAPTFRAYQYLKSLDLDHIPAANTVVEPPHRTVRIANLVSGCNHLQKDLAALAFVKKGHGKAVSSPDPAKAKKEILPRIHALIEAADAAMTRPETTHAGPPLTPADLPAPSRRAYQWLKFLSQPENLDRHLTALAAAVKAAESAACRKKLPLLRQSIPIQVEFYNIPALFRSRVVKGAIYLSVSEAFIFAPQAVIEALICAVLLPKNTSAVRKVRTFAASDIYTQAAQMLALSSPHPTHAAYGRIYDLEEVFNRVNREYFNGEVPRPALVWNRTITRRKLGHYDFPNDTVMISLTLDSPKVPDYVIDFVMYHELLHKKLGTTLSKGRRYAHTPAFRQAERQFKHFDRAETFLKNLGKF